MARRLAKRDEICFIQLQIRMEVERTAMMNLQLFRPAAYRAARILFEEMLADGRPVRRARSSDRMLALSSIDKVANDGHKRKSPHAAGYW